MSEEETTSTDPLAGQSGATLISWGALAVLASWLVFDVALDEYGVTPMAVLFGLAVTLLPRIDGAFVSSLGWFTKLVGYGLALTGVVEFLADIDSNVFDSGPAIVAALACYAGYVLAFLGARKA